MKSTLPWYMRFILKRICRFIATQGPLHKARITEYYRIMANEAKEEFREDNEYSLCSFLLECQADAMEMKYHDLQISKGLTSKSKQSAESSG